MNFVLKMAWRDSRASRRRLLLFSLSIVLGVAALVAIGSFRDNLRQAVEDQSKQLLGADLAVTSRQRLPEALGAYLAGVGGEEARETSFSSMIVFPSRGGQTRIVQVRALEGPFPFYGQVMTTPAGAFAKLAGAGYAVLENTLLAQFGLKVGDPVRIGEATFTIAGALDKMPGESPAVAMLAPRVYIPLGALGRTRLIQPGSLVRYRAWYKLPATVDVEALVGELRQRFGDQRLGFDTVEHRKRDLGRAAGERECLSESGGIHRAVPGGDRRGERDPRACPPEDRDHRHPPVPRGDGPAEFRHLSRAGDGTRLGRRGAGRGARARRAAGVAGAVPGPAAG